MRNITTVTLPSILKAYLSREPVKEESKMPVIKQNILQINELFKDSNKMNCEPEKRNDILELFGERSENIQPSIKPNKIEALFQEEIAKPEKIKKPASNNIFLNWDDSIKEDDKVWYYKDLKGGHQGPFNSFEMNAWHSAGYFFDDLMISFKDKTSYQPLKSIVNKKIDTIENFFAKEKQLAPDNKQLNIADLFGSVGNTNVSHHVNELFKQN